jgi:hypothetical protein
MTGDSLRPLPINFGDPDPSDVVGRRALLDDIRRYLEHGSSVLLAAGRRRGKSWVVKALVSTAPAPWVPLYLDVEHLRSVEELLRTVAGRLREALPLHEQVVDALIGVDTEVAARGAKAAHAATPPGDRLARVARVLADDGRNLLLVLDELPIMVRTMSDREPDEALLLLRTLRALRHERPNVRLVCAGSIGFHHIRDDAAEVAAAINDLQVIPVGPLARADAVLLARRLLLGIGVRTEPDDVVAAAIADATDGIPFYAHKLVDALDQRRRAGLAVDYAAVWDCRNAAVSRSGGDPWELDYHPHEVAAHYGHGAEGALALAVLDALARDPSGAVPFDTLLDRVRLDERVASGPQPVGRDQLLAIVQRLRRDHDIDTSGNVVSFTSSVLRDAWRATRFLR